MSRDMRARQGFVATTVIALVSVVALAQAEGREQESLPGMGVQHSPVETAASHRPSQETADPADGAVLLIEVTDVSRSVRNVLQRYTAEMSKQYKASLRPGDSFARIVFNESARLSDLRTIRSRDDIDDLARLTALAPMAGGATRISQGLQLALSVASERRRNRGLVLVIGTDGVIWTSAAKELEKERSDLRDVALAWRGRENAQIIIAGVSTGASSDKALRDLAELLNARLVPIDRLLSEQLIPRSVTTVRETNPSLSTKTPSAPSVAPRQPILRLVNLEWTNGLVIAGLLFSVPLLVLYWRHRSRLVPLAAAAHLPEPAVLGPLLDVQAVVTTAAGTRRTIVRVPEDIDSHRLRLGRNEAINLPGLPPGAATLLLNPMPAQLKLAPMTGLTVDGQAVPPEGGTVSIGPRVQLSWGQNVAVLQVHTRATSRRPSHSRKAVLHGS